MAAKAAMLREAMTLEELRKARALSQEDIATTLTVGQSAVAKLEKRTDMHVSNLRRYIEALGGTLEITARFPDASVVLSNIGEGTPANANNVKRRRKVMSCGGERHRVPSEEETVINPDRHGPPEASLAGSPIEVSREPCEVQ